jgi:hypothetical protein
MPTASQTITLAAEPGETPVTIVATVITMECQQERDFLGIRHGLCAQIAITAAPEVRPHTYFLSRLVGESCWVVDAQFGSNGFPHFSHGFGARYLRLRGCRAGTGGPARSARPRPRIGPGHRSWRSSRAHRGRGRSDPRVVAPAAPRATRISTTTGPAAW